jgi:uncharacterized membrane protein
MMRVMKRYEEQITIAAPAQSVYEYVSDFERHGEWSGHGLQVTKETESPVAVGTRYSTVAKLFGTQREHSVITEMTPGQEFAWDSTGALGRVHHRFSISGDDASVVLTKSAEFVEPTFLAKLTGWKLSRDVPKSLRSDLAKIKATLERSPT